MTFEGTGIVDITSETALVFEDGVTGEDVNIEETPVVTFTADTAPVVKVVSADGQRTILVEFGKVIARTSRRQKNQLLIPAGNRRTRQRRPSNGRTCHGRTNTGRACEGRAGHGRANDR
ncbi:hypothetical protein OVA29_02770 [Exiguobacterium sp. SL14]|nr:hypothetical protein [Exiguobacterium sp. SL14]MCY1689862.1 hypothetical protein [Exiguobacterium sp. SL14]